MRIIFVAGAVLALASGVVAHATASRVLDGKQDGRRAVVEARADVDLDASRARAVERAARVHTAANVTTTRARAEAALIPVVAGEADAVKARSAVDEARLRELGRALLEAGRGSSCEEPGVS